MNTYLLFKSLHLIAVISWMAGLLYLPRIFVYHAETINNKDKYDTFLVMERRLLIYIMNPSMILSWIFGLLLVHSNGINSFGELWMIIKIILVLVLTFTIFTFLVVIKVFLKMLTLIHLNFTDLLMRYQLYC